MKSSSRPHAQILPTTLLGLLATACGGGGGGEDPQQGGGPVLGNSPTVSLRAPVASGVTDASTITVRGTATPGTAPVEEVTLNGLPATTSNDFETWQVQVPLKSGTNTFTISARGEDQVGLSATPGVAVERVDPILVRPGAVAVDPTRDLLYVGDTTRDEVFVFDPETGARKLLSGPTQGSGPSFMSIYDLEYDPVKDRLLLLDTTLDAIFEIDAKSGDRRLVAAEDSFNAPTLRNSTAIAMLPGTDRLLYVSFASGLSEVDLATGKLRTISSDEPNLGPALISPKGLAYDPALDAVYVADSGRLSLFRIDYGSGKRELFSEHLVADGPPLLLLATCKLSPVHGLVALSQHGAFYSISLADGARTLIADDAVGEGPDLEGMRDFVFDGDRIFAPSGLNAGVWRVDVPTGDRELIGRTSVGSGEGAGQITSLALDEEGNILAANFGFSAKFSILRVSRAGGHRTTISSENTGTGEMFSGPVALDVNRLTGELIVLDFTDDLYVVDPDSGDRELLELDSDGPEDPDAVAWLPGSTVQSIILDGADGSLYLHNRVSGETTAVSQGIETADFLATLPDGERVVVASEDEIYSVELSSGLVTPVSLPDDSVGGGVEIDTINAIAADGPRERLFYFDEDLGQLVEVDLATGQRTLVSSAQRGTGPSLFNLHALAVSDNGLTVYAYDAALRGLSAISTETGDRVVFSR